MPTTDRHPEALRPPIDALEELGPGSGRTPPSEADAVAYCRALTLRTNENFSVLSRLVPPDLRDPFAAVYAYCRWADDLADETHRLGLDPAAARTRAAELLAWWRSELERCFAGDADHPVFVALRPVVERHRLRPEPFHDLLTAFEQDQRVSRYRTWEELLGYCRGSADPVGRIVLQLGGLRPPDEAPANERLYAMSDAACTALQLANFWQDVRRDLLERDRVYMPFEETGLSAETLRDWAQRPEDPGARVPFIKALRPLVRRTAAIFDEASGLPRALGRPLGPVVALLVSGGRAVLRKVETRGCTTLWDRPTLRGPEKAVLVARAALASARMPRANAAARRTDA